MIGQESDTIIVPTAILAEIDFLLRVRLGSRAVFRFLEGITIGGYTLEPCTSNDLERCQSLLRTYENLNLGLADTAVIATAERLNARRILTVDVRHFRAVRAADGRPFTLLPADV